MQASEQWSTNMGECMIWTSDGVLHSADEDTTGLNEDRLDAVLAGVATSCMMYDMILL